MNPILEKLTECYVYIRSVTDFKPEIGLVLGSGLGGLADQVEKPLVIEFRDVPGFPVSTVSGHNGRFVLGYLGGAPVIVMQGRVHYYEGYPIEDVVLPPRLMALLGVKVLFLTNASGGIDRDFHAGDFMMITDHILSFCPNPLVGPNIDELGVRFPDMSEVYDRELRRLITKTSLELDIPIKSGVYAQLTGPSFETPAEIRMLERLGISAVGMSTACEAVAAKHMGVRVCGISFVSNPAAGISPNPLSHAEVIEAADKAAPMFRALVVGSIANIHKSLKEV